MRDADNDNEPLSFITLLAATRNVTRFLKAGEQKQEDGDRETGRSDADDDNRRRHSEAVEEGLKRLRAFERRAAGLVRRKD